MKNDGRYITIAKIGAPFGVRGWLKIQSFTESIENVIHYQPWFISDKNGEMSELNIEQVDFNHGRLLAKIKDINTPEDARQYTGKILSIPKAKLPALNKGEYYWSDLEGLTVVNQVGAILGTVSYLLETGANDVLVVKGDKQIAIPYLPGRVVKNVDLEKQEIQVEWEE